DTTALTFYALKNGVRHRRRVNLSDPNDRKSGRELVQIKINNISDNVLARGELKFDVKQPAVIKDADDRHPLLGLIRRDERDDFKNKLKAFKADPYAMRPIVTVHDIRKRIYLEKDGKPFLSISLDRVDAGVMWVKARFIEIEPELNEITFTEADPAGKNYMQKIEKELIDDIEFHLPYVKSNLTPKYNKSVDRISEKLPFFKQVLGAGFGYSGVLFLALVCIGALFFLMIAGLKRLLNKK
ncbi:MAG: hypothetical protein PHT32_04855, partial [Candidatus Omnitrophica bacterium]|nr:hypothetical protein [Candidatus Omnitrophota bacterium]